MRFYSKLFCVGVGFYSLFFCLGGAKAQESYDKALLNALLQAEQDLARLMSGATKRDPNEYRFISMALRGKPVEKGKPNVVGPEKLPPLSDFLTVMRKNPAVKHFIGAEGTELVLESASSGVPRSNAQFKPAALFQESLKRAAKELAQIDPLPLCEKPTMLRESVKERSEELHNDILLYRETKDLPSLSGLFGSRVILVQCSNQKGDICARSALSLNLRCLPTRVRTFGGNVFRFEGSSALKNFDTKPQGVVTPEISEVLPMLLGGDR